MRTEGNDGDQLFKKLLDISGNKFAFSDFYSDKGWNMDALRKAIGSIETDRLGDAVGDPQQRDKNVNTRKPSVRHRADDRKDCASTANKGREERSLGGQKRKRRMEQQRSRTDAKKPKRDSKAPISGKVVQFLRSKQYGFLSVAGYAKDVFFHKHDVIGQNDLSDGCLVTISRIVEGNGQKAQAFGLKVVKSYCYGPAGVHHKGGEPSRNSVLSSAHHSSGSVPSRIHRSRSVSPRKTRPGRKYRSRTPPAMETAVGSAPRERPRSAQRTGAKGWQKRAEHRNKQAIVGSAPRESPRSAQQEGAQGVQNREEHWNTRTPAESSPRERPQSAQQEDAKSWQNRADHKKKWTASASAPRERPRSVQQEQRAKGWQNREEHLKKTTTVGSAPGEKPPSAKQEGAKNWQNRVDYGEKRITAVSMLQERPQSAQKEGANSREKSSAVRSTQSGAGSVPRKQPVSAQREGTVGQLTKAASRNTQIKAKSAPREGPRSARRQRSGSVQHKGVKVRENHADYRNEQTASRRNAGHGADAAKARAPRTFTTHGHIAVRKLPRMLPRRGARVAPCRGITLRRNISIRRRSPSRHRANRGSAVADGEKRRSSRQRTENQEKKGSKKSLFRARRKAQGPRRKWGGVDRGAAERTGKTRSRSRALGSTAATSRSPVRCNDRDHLAVNHTGANSRSPVRDTDKSRLAFSNAGTLSRSAARCSDKNRLATSNADSPARADDKDRLALDHAGATSRDPPLGEQRASPLASRAASDSVKKHENRRSVARSPVSLSEERDSRENSGGSILGRGDTLSAGSPSATSSIQADYGDSVSPAARGAPSGCDLPVPDERAQEESRSTGEDDRGPDAQHDQAVSAKSELVPKASGPRPPKVFTTQRQATVVKWWPHKAYGFIESETLQEEIGELVFFRFPKGQYDLKIGDTICFDRLRFSEGGDPCAVNPMIQQPASSSSRNRPPLTLVSQGLPRKEQEDESMPRRETAKVVYSSRPQSDVPSETPASFVAAYGTGQNGREELGGKDPRRPEHTHTHRGNDREMSQRRHRTSQRVESRGRSTSERNLSGRNGMKQRSSDRRSKSAAERHIVPRTIFFSNLPFDFTTKECENLFSRVGAIAQLRLFAKKNGMSKGMGTCCFEKEGVAERAMANLQGKLIGQKNPRKLFIELHNK